MSLTLTISDNQNGSGGVATIAGSTGGSTNTLYYLTFLGLQEGYPWISYGSRTGDGTIDVSLPVANFFWYVENNHAGNLTLSNLVFQGLTNTALQSVHYRCLLAYQSTIQGLGLSGFTSDQIVIQWLPRSWQTIDTGNLPLIFIVPIGKEGQFGVLNNRDDIGYKIVVAICDKQNQNYTENLEAYTLVRQQIARAFRHQRLLGVIEIITTDIEYDYTINPELFNSNYLWSAIEFTPRSREVRGQ